MIGLMVVMLMFYSGVVSVVLVLSSFGSWSFSDEQVLGLVIKTMLHCFR